MDRLLSKSECVILQSFSFVVNDLFITFVSINSLQSPPHGHFPSFVIYCLMHRPKLYELPTLISKSKQNE